MTEVLLYDNIILVKGCLSVMDTEAVAFCCLGTYIFYLLINNDNNILIGRYASKFGMVDNNNTKK